MKLSLGEAHAAKPVHDTALNAMRQGMAKPTPGWAHLARARLSLGDASGVCGSLDPIRLLDVVAPY